MHYIGRLQVAKYFWVWELDIKFKSNLIESHAVKMDATYYLQNHLDCNDENELNQKITKTKDKTFKELSEYAGSYCDYMHNNLLENVLHFYREHAEKVGIVEGDVSEEAYDDFSYSLKSSYFLIDGRRF